MKKNILPIVLVIIIAIAAFGAGNDYGRSERTKELKKVIDSSIIEKKKYKQYIITQPVQEYNKQPVMYTQI